MFAEACQNAELAAAKAQHVERQKQLCDVLYEKVRFREEGRGEGRLGRVGAEVKPNMWKEGN